MPIGIGTRSLVREMSLRGYWGTTLMSTEPAPTRIDLHPAVWLVPAGALLIALLPLPYGFYTLMRLVVCGAAIILAYQEYLLHNQMSGWLVIFAVLALLFNPLIPIYLTREIWAPIDIGAAIIFVLHWRHRSTKGKDA
ncbi:unnamed protein product [marine sediment metagenome]|uniref:Uncharacterized protein n=1 Tax=marine sediment metagenome TaxID=412755 RepID=X0UWC6_9ZZZZ